MPLPGVFITQKKDGTTYYRSSITYSNKHISLGSFSTEEEAHQAYSSALQILHTKQRSPSILDTPHYEDYLQKKYKFSFDKWIMLLNLRDSRIYCRNPIYLQQSYFLYYLSYHMVLKFDTDDLFYYMKHKIMQRGGHLFVCEYGMQVSILSRYGIRNFSVVNRDYRFTNGDSTDFRYRNIQIINRYFGVTKAIQKGKDIYTTKIHLNGNYLVGRYATEVEAAIAYNKAANYLKSNGFAKEFPENYIDSLDDISYSKIYNSIRLSTKIREYPKILPYN